MKYTLECVILEITEKTFRDKNGETRSYFIAQAYQPGVGVDTIGISKEAAGKVQPGKNGYYAVEFSRDDSGRGKPRIVDVVA